MKRPKQDKLLEAWRKMSAGDVIRLMIESVRDPVIKLDMDTFGNIVRVPGTPPPNKLPKYECVACAATNTLLRLMNKRPQEATRLKFIEQGYLEMCGYLGSYVGSTFTTVNAFESSINQLRSGVLGAYNYHAKELGGIAPMQWPLDGEDGYYPPLTNNDWKDRIHIYEELALYNDREPIEEKINVTITE